MELSKAHFRTMPEAESKQLFIEFVKQVRTMRDKQKEYFRTRNQITLRESKALEREVDFLAKNLFSEEENPGLF